MPKENQIVHTFNLEEWSYAVRHYMSWAQKSTHAKKFVLHKPS